MGPNGQYQPLLSLARTDLPQAIAQQIAVAVQSQGAGKSTIDLQLAPEELGRVRLRLTSHEGVVAVSVLAERPETLDLLRRHIETLARGLLDVGYQEARFAFSGQNPGGSPSKTLNAQGATHREDEGRGAVPDLSVPPALSSPALAGARINVLI
jgi:flagellar hook-length control protein FliK